MPVPRLIHFWPTVSAFILGSKSSKISSSDDSTSPKSNSGDSLVVDFEHKAYFRFWILCHHTFHRVQTVNHGRPFSQDQFSLSFPFSFLSLVAMGALLPSLCFTSVGLFPFLPFCYCAWKTSRVGFIFVLFFPKIFYYLLVNNSLTTLLRLPNNPHLSVR